VIIFWFARR